MKPYELEIVKNAESFDWYSFTFEFSINSKEFYDRFKDKIKRFTYQGRLHREDGPAVKTENFHVWWLYGKVHRVDGPAIIWLSLYADEGRYEYYLNNKHLSKEDWEESLRKK